MKFNGIVHILLPVFVEFEVPTSQQCYVNNISVLGKEAAAKAFEPASMVDKIPEGAKTLTSGRDIYWRKK